MFDKNCGKKTKENINGKAHKIPTTASLPNKWSLVFAKENKVVSFIFGGWKKQYFIDNRESFIVGTCS